MSVSISPELKARVFLSLGRASRHRPDRSLRDGERLISDIQEELNEAFTAGVKKARETQPTGHQCGGHGYTVGGGGSSGSGSGLPVSVIAP